MGWLGPTIALHLASVAAPATDTAAVPQEQVALGDVQIVTAQTDSETRLTVPVRLGEHGTYRFLIDTGSQRTVLASEIARRLALPSGRRLRITGLAGSEIVDTAQVDEIGLGARSLPTSEMPLFESRHIGADGIVGLDSLQDQRVLLDFARNTIAVGNARALGGDRGYEIVVSARRRSGQLIMTQATIDGVPTNIVIDTGSSVSVGNRALQRALRQRADLTRLVLISVTGQEATADLGFARKLAIKDVSIANPAIAFADAPPFAALGLDRKPALLLGMRELRLFGRVAIDFKSRRILFDAPDRL